MTVSMIRISAFVIYSEFPKIEQIFTGTRPYSMKYSLTKLSINRLLSQQGYYTHEELFNDTSFSYITTSCDCILHLLHDCGII